MFKNRNATEEPEKVFIHIIRYADNETKKDWQGKMQNIREVVVEESKSIKKEIKQEIEKQNAKIESKIESIEQKIDQMMNLLKKWETAEIEKIKTK